MADSVTELQLNDYLDIVRRRKALIALLAVVAIGAAIAVSALQTPQFLSHIHI